MTENDFSVARRRMIRDLIHTRGVQDRRVLEAMARIPRHLFVPNGWQPLAYVDRPLPIGLGQTISQPWMVAHMTELLALQGTEKVLEIGMGSGYQSAVLAELAAEVYTVEKIPSLRRSARRALRTLGYNNVRAYTGDGTLGWPEHQPYDAVLVAAGAPHVPQPLVAQLKPGGRLVIPVGDRHSQELYMIRRTPYGIAESRLGACRFVALLGKYGW